MSKGVEIYPIDFYQCQRECHNSFMNFDHITKHYNNFERLLYIVFV